MAKTLKDLPLGAKIKHPGMKYNGKVLTWVKVTNNGHYKPGETIFIIDYLIGRKAFDAEEPRNSNSVRKSYGNNNYELSNIDQWLNSTSKNWYSARHGADQAPTGTYVMTNPYADEAGFLFNFTDEAIENIRETTIKSAKHSADGGGITNLKRKIFLMSRTEAGLGDEFSGRAEGKHFPYFTSDEKRATGSFYWLRTPNADDASRARLMHSTGSLSWDSSHRGDRGVRPALSLLSSVLVTSQDTNGVWEIAFNRPPTISGRNQDLGNVSDEINYKYTVFDEDNDTLSIVERLNNEVIEVRNNVKSGSEFTTTIPKEKIYSLELGKKNTLQIEVSDGQERVYRNITFTRINTAPILQVLSEKNLGEIIKPFENIIKVTDIENDSVDIVYKTILVEKVNNNIKKTLIHQDKVDNIKLDSELKYSIPQSIFSLLLNGDYELEITAIDSQGGESKEVVKFTRTEDTIDYLSNVIETEVMAKQIMIMPTVSGTPKSIKIMACNNAFDDKKAWEDVTNEALNMLPYNFKNTSKTAAKWGVQTQFILSGKGDK